jgi:hypothetical protein
MVVIKADGAPGAHAMMIRHAHLDRYPLAHARSPPQASTHQAELVCQILSTLMSAFPSSGRMNSSLYLKRAFQAVPGRAGGAVVMTTVDHTLVTA